MEKFTVLRGVAAPLLQPNINTDAIIPAQWLASTAHDLGEKLFAGWRYDLKGAEIPDFILNQPRYRASKIMIGGVNFGCGSSREAAVWALMRFGIRSVIAPSFGDIFFENSLQNGLVPVRVSIDEARRLAEQVAAAPEPLLTVDLTRDRVVAPAGGEIAFSLPAERREALLEGLKEIDLLARFADDVTAYQAQDAVQRPWVYERSGGLLS
jgi:3-isopropylmalate/(R)-2-methylmalate dehydratase small subunit